MEPSVNLVSESGPAAHPVHPAPVKSGFFKRVPVHPLLLALYVPIFAFAHNFSEVYTHELWLPLLSFLFVGVFVYGVMRLVLGSWKKSAVLSWVILVFLLLYGLFIDAYKTIIAPNTTWFLIIFGVLFGIVIVMRPLRRGLLRVLHDLCQKWKFIITSVILAGVIVFLLIANMFIHDFHIVPVIGWVLIGFITCLMLSGVHITEKFYDGANRALLIATCIFLLTPLAQIAYAAVTSDVQVISTNDAMLLSGDIDAEHLPDIYYIIPDEYAGRETLLQVFNFSNDEFLNFLDEEGFYVVNDSSSNYNKTHISIPSSLNVNFVEELIDTNDLANAQKALFQLNENNLVVKTLKQSGYTYVHVGSRWSISGENANADIAYSYEGLSHFNELLVESTLLRALNSPAVVFDFDTLKKVPELKQSPKFVFAHMPVPHAPFFYDKDGNILPAEEWYDHDHYLGQLQYINKELQEIITAIQEKSTRPVVIILQSDHGFRFCGRLSAPQVDCDTVNGFNNINAYYFSDGDYADLYSGITPVNSFRVVFNKYLGMNYSMLPDKVDFEGIPLEGD